VIYEKALDEITKDDLDALVREGVREDQRLDYKRELPGRKDSDKKEFAQDLCSFANASGGLMIFGVTEFRDSDGKPTGLPESIDGLPDNPDEVTLHLEQRSRDGLTPRIPGLQVRHIEGFPNGAVFLVKVPRSWAGPHLVDRESRFYTRAGAGKHPLDVNQLRAAFALSESVPDRIRSFRNERLGRILAGETPVPIHKNRPLTVIHVVPLEGMSLSAPRVDYTASLEPWEGNWPVQRHNFDGILQASGRNPQQPANYRQVFRNGSVEDVFRDERYGDAEGPAATLPSFAYSVIRTSAAALEGMKSAGVSCPAYVLVSVLRARGLTLIQTAIGGMKDEKAFLTHPPAPIVESDLIFSEVVVKAYPSDLGHSDVRGSETSRILRPVINMFAQSFGLPSSEHRFGRDGSWA